MRLVVRLRQVMDSRNVGPVDLSRALGMNRDQVAAIRDRKFKEVSRRDLQALWTWTKRFGGDFLDLEPDPVWDTFAGSAATVILGHVERDIEIMTRMTKVMRSKLVGANFNRIWEQRYTATQVAEKMKTENCVFIGAPKRNRTSEFAYAQLYGADPDDVSQANCEKLPVRFAAVGWTETGQSTVSVEAVSDVSDSGLLVRHGKQTVQLPVNYLADHKYEGWSGRGIDGGALIICRKPFKTKANVTTIIIAGFTGLSSAEITEDLIWEMTDIEASELKPGHPVARILKVPYRKLKLRSEREATDTDRAWFDPDKVSSEEWRRVTGKPEPALPR